MSGASPREQAVAAAEGALAAVGFTRADVDAWRGPLLPEAGLAGSVSLPGDFPFALPEVRVDRRRLPRRMPHVERDGKICIAPNTGIQLVTQRPADLVLDAVERARAVLREGINGQNRSDFQLEFLAYWGARAAIGPIYSICAAGGPSREIVGVQVAAARTIALSGATLFADNSTQLRDWVGRLGVKTTGADRALFFRADGAFDPPDFEDVLSVEALLVLLRRHAAGGDRAFLAAQSAGRLQLPLMVLVSMPLPDLQDRVVFGARLPRGTTNDHGYRRGHVPLGAALLRARREPVQAATVRRLDAAYMLERGGGQRALLDKSVVLVGCGSVGGPTAMHLAAAGVGKLHLIDHDTSATDNVHRDALGVAGVGDRKVLGLQRALGARFPHIKVTVDDGTVQDVLVRDHARFDGADLVVVAVGDPTLESWLNRGLHGKARRLHVWIEPHGLGGHVLLTAPGRAPGCFECLLDHGDHPRNRASLAGSDQDFGRSLGGCAGTFTPYGELDADQAAIYATRLAIDVLRGDDSGNVLLSWLSGRGAFQSAGYKLSDRGETMSDGSQRRETAFVNPACSTCSHVA